MTQREVKAVLSFDGFRQNGVYSVDDGIGRIRALISAGYLVPTSKEQDNDPVDSGQSGGVSGRRVAVRMARRKTKAAVNDEPDPAEPPGDSGSDTA